MKAYQKLIQDAFSALVCGDAAEKRPLPDGRT
jgi:hypothetical protein